MNSLTQAQKDSQTLNRLREQVEAAMREYHGNWRVDQDLAAHIAERIHKNIPPGTHVNRLHRITTGDIINKIERDQIMRDPYEDDIPEGGAAVIIIMLAITAILGTIAWIVS